MTRMQFFRMIHGRRLVIVAVFGFAVTVAGCTSRPGSPERRSEPADAPGWPPPAVFLERGGAIYQASCASCHGRRGEGEPNWKTPNADGTYPAPPHDASGHTWHHTDALLFEIVRDGGSRYNSASFRSRMPAWGTTLSDDESAPSSVCIYFVILAFGELETRTRGLG